MPEHLAFTQYAAVGLKLLRCRILVVAGQGCPSTCVTVFSLSLSRPFALSRRRFKDHGPVDCRRHGVTNSIFANQTGFGKIVHRIAHG